MTARTEGADPVETAGWSEMAPPPQGKIATGRLAMDDGASLFYRLWLADSPETLLFVHGLGGHGGWYNDLGNSLAARGLNVLIPDLRGFGRSGGERGHVERRSRLVDDMAAVGLRAGDLTGGRRVHLAGHSMGAIIAVHLAARTRFSSLSLLNPWLEDTASVSSSTVTSIALGGMRGSKRLWKLGTGSVNMTDNEEARAYLESDPLWVQEQTSTFLFQVTLLRLAATRAARAVTAPALVLQGKDDRVVRHEASRRLYAAIGAPQKQWTDPDCHHDFQFGRQRSAIDALLAGWCHENAGPGI